MTDVEALAMDEEISHWPEVGQSVSGIDWSVHRKLRVKNPNGMPKSAELLVTSKHFGWWDPRTDKWWFFYSKYRHFDADDDSGFAEVVLPKDFDGGKLLNQGFNDDKVPFVVGRTGKQEFGSLLRPGTLTEIADIPRHILPKAKINRKEMLHVAGVAFLRKKLLVVWEQGGRSVGVSNIPSMNAIRGIRSVPAASVSVTSSFPAVLSKMDECLEDAWGQTWFRERISPHKSELAGLSSATGMQVGNQVNCYWSQAEGFIFFGDIDSQYHKFQFPSHRLVAPAPEGLIYARLDFIVPNSRKKVDLGYEKIVGQIAPASGPRINFRLSTNYTPEPDDFEWRSGDKVLCILGARFTGSHALIGREDGTAVGWERCMCVADALPRGWLNMPHRRNFVSPEIMERPLAAFRSYMTNSLQL